MNEEPVPQVMHPMVMEEGRATDTPMTMTARPPWVEERPPVGYLDALNAPVAATSSIGVQPEAPTNFNPQTEPSSVEPPSPDVIAAVPEPETPADEKSADAPPDDGVAPNSQPTTTEPMQGATSTGDGTSNDDGDNPPKPEVASKP